ncbi:MAG TPA: S26 family signal peptidase [Sphingomicrobium sp.]|nr:S26 family signal peptidase [Sphingomicrobium sp.]
MAEPPPGTAGGRVGAAIARGSRKRAWVIALASAAIVLLGVAATIAAEPRAMILWNRSASVPAGLYLLRPAPNPGRGAMVAAMPPPAAVELAARRRYLPRNVPLVKRVAAVPGDSVCADGERVTVNARLAAVRWRSDGLGRPLPWWSGCVKLGTNAYLLLGTSPDSFDGRYFGATPRDGILGEAKLLWPAG